MTRKIGAAGTYDFYVNGTGGNPANFGATYYLFEYMGTNGIWLGENVALETSVYDFGGSVGSQTTAFH